MVTVLGRAEVSQLFSSNLVASLGSVAVAATLAVVLARLLWRRSASDTVIAAFWAPTSTPATWGSRWRPTCWGTRP